MLTPNMTIDELAVTEEWKAIYRGLQCIFSRQSKDDGGWSAAVDGGRSNTRCTAHVIAPLLDIYPVGQSSIAQAITFLSGRAFQLGSVYWLRRTDDGFDQEDIPATLVSTYVLLRYHYLAGIPIEPSPDYLARSGQAIVEKVIADIKRHVGEASCWVFLAAASVLAEVSGNDRLWGRLLASTDTYQSIGTGGVNTYSSSRKRSRVLETAEVLHCFLKSGHDDIERLANGVEYILKEADNLNGHICWQGPGGAASFGPLLSTRYIILFLAEYRERSKSQDITDQLDFALRSAAHWIARSQKTDGSWIGIEGTPLAANFCGYAVQALWKVIKLSCRSQDHHKLLERVVNDVGKVEPGTDDVKKVVRIPAVGHDVFIVHGRDDGLKNEVARFIEKLGLKAVILHEQPDRGRTIIQKIEDYSDVRFAVVLETPDDIGAIAGQPHLLRPRPRQNVLIELGYFVGKLGRHNVAVLRKGDIESPSDYKGVLYIRVDEGNDWKRQLVKELKAAGLDADANRAFN